MSKHLSVSLNPVTAPSTAGRITLTPQLISFKGKGEWVASKLRDKVGETEIIGRFSDMVVRSDFCYATTNRQETVKQLSRLADFILVVGAQNSSNCNRLREVAEANGVRAYLINGPDEIDRQWFDGVQGIGITPEEMVLAVIDALAPDSVSSIDGVAEDTSFDLPQELRD